jgi:hypothetical protein
MKSLKSGKRRAIRRSAYGAANAGTVFTPLAKVCESPAKKRPAATFKGGPGLQ